ncbi:MULTISPECIES: amidohydrolase [unclassified Modestobacter]|uniref:amidohydrolase n=1 Tax=unclassified Modestobacter TaxID=2643866 RepID=UPI0022AAED28|nr:MULTISPECIES: amidohydrolase [unclassified Modestobacter]MCZ2826165.1 amidohydrolase family protein [Modestobacter sp. VKM Ac-2981]MCZ2852770.1 amidohydrolase family protein [Modestobacter sp. VKM Ac-2982]
MDEHQITRRNALKVAASVAAATGFAVASPTAAHAGPRSRRGADTVVMNGKVLTMHRGRECAEAVAMKDGLIVAVGSNREMARLVHRGTNVVDAGGGTVLPGINDGHLHFNGFGFEASNFGFAGPKIYSYDVAKPTVAEIAAVIAQAVAEAPTPDSWIRASGWDGTRLDRLPTRDVLDAVSGDHPVYMSDISHHALAANSKAMQLAGITRDTPTPSGGTIEKDAAGEPTGIFRESASGLVAAAVPPYTPAEISEAMDFAASVLHSLGITSLTDPGVSLDQVELYRGKIRDGSLKLRFNLMLRAGQTAAALQETLSGLTSTRDDDPRMLRVREVKVLADGVPTDAATSWLYEPFLDGRNGHLLSAGEDDAERLESLRAIIAVAAANGFQVGTHATGDAAIDAVVAGYLATRTNALRHYVIHGDLTPLKTLELMAANDIGVSFNPTIKQVYSRFFDSTIGPERVDYQWPFRSALDAGVKASSASDAAVVTPDWLIGVAGAVTRLGFDGKLGGIEQAISIEESLRSYTSTPAWQDHAERWKGQLRPGFAGDVAILDGDLLQARTAEEITGHQVIGTVFGGQVVYDATTSTAPGMRAGAAKVAAYRHQSSVACSTKGAGCCCRANEELMSRQHSGRA